MCIWDVGMMVAHALHKSTCQPFDHGRENSGARGHFIDARVPCLISICTCE